MSLGKKLKGLRNTKVINQNEVAQLLGIDRSTYGKYETGDSTPDYEKLVKLAQYFNVTTDWLLNNPLNPSFDKETNDLLEVLHKRPEMKTLFSISQKASKEDIEKAMRIIEALKDE